MIAAWLTGYRATGRKDRLDIYEHIHELVRDCPPDRIPLTPPSTKRLGVPIPVLFRVSSCYKRFLRYFLAYIAVNFYPGCSESPLRYIILLSLSWVSYLRRPIRIETATILKHQTLDFRKWETTRNVNSTTLRLCEGNFKDFLSSDIVRPLNKNKKMEVG